MPCLGKKIWEASKNCKNSWRFGNIWHRRDCIKVWDLICYLFLFVYSSLLQNKYFGMLKNINGSLVNIKTIAVLPNGHWTLSRFNKKLDFLPTPVSNLPNVVNSNTSDLIFFAVWNHTLCEGNNDYPNIVKFKIDKAKLEHFKSVKMKILHLFKTFTLNHGMTFQ